MAKYKKLTPELIEGFLDKMFGRIATQAGKQVAKDMGKKDPNAGELLNRAWKLAGDMEKHLKSMSPSKREKYKKDLWKKAGIK